MSDLDRFLQDPNGPAYQVDQVRHGPPLEYIGEKLRSALDAQHRLLRALDTSAAGAPGSPRPAIMAKEDAAPVDVEAALHSAIAAFHYLITAYLALHNMLGSHTGPDYLQRLRSMSDEDFDRWLAFIESEGSVNGGS